MKPFNVLGMMTFLTHECQVPYLKRICDIVKEFMFPCFSFAGVTHTCLFSSAWDALKSTLQTCLDLLVWKY